MLLFTTEIDTTAIGERSVLTGQPAREGRVFPLMGGGVACGVGVPVQQARTNITSAEIAELSERLDVDSEVLETLRDVFLRVCRNLRVSEPADPQGAAIARTLIAVALASDGECDARELYRRTMNSLRTVQ
jgi:hypothetical protein